jgi:hypothetical protein
VKWINRLPLILAVLGSLVSGPVSADTYNYYNYNGNEPPIPRPVETERCLLQGPFSCLASEKVFSMRGVSCIEDCHFFDRLNNCQLSNQCNWDPTSGCFLKDVCIDVNALHRCRRWEREAVCD